MTSTLKIFHCTQCKAEFEAEPINLFGREMFTRRMCASCTETEAAKYDAEQARLAQAGRRAFLNETIPDIYFETELDRLPPQLRALAENWRPINGIGLGLCGDSQIGKTRTAYKIVERMVLEGKRVVAILSTDWAKAVGKQYSNNARAADEAETLLADALTCDVLFMDDVGREKMTASVASELFTLIEKRAGRKRPFIWTTNKTGKELIEHIHDGRAVVKRLCEFCELPKL
jgi:DNA replication protein DnaC